MKQARPTYASRFIAGTIHQECDSALGRLTQALGVAEHDQVEGVRGFRRAVKKIRCALQLTAGEFSAQRREDLDGRWSALSRRLGLIRDLDAGQKKAREMIGQLPAQYQTGAEVAWAVVCEDSNSDIHAQHRRELIEGVSADAEQLVCETEKIGFANLTPEMVAGSLEHLWTVARAQASKSWVNRDEDWLHSLRKRVQRAHLAFRLLRPHGGDRAMELEKRLDEAAKALGELRDTTKMRMRFPLSPPKSMPASAVEALEMLQILVARAQSAAACQARGLVLKAFRLGIGKSLRSIALQLRAA